MNQHASVNRAFRLIWNHARNAWIPVAETTSARGKRNTRGSVWLAPLLSVVGLAQVVNAANAPPVPTQLPSGGVVVAGSATLSATGTASAPVLDVNQTSSRAVVDWSTFSLGSASTVDFNQPNSNSATLNRVLGSNPSEIFGQIHAPGQVFLVNPSGVYFGKSASVNVGGLTATTSSIANADFMAGRFKFSRDGATGSVVNDGALKASLGGYIALLAPDVRNDGVVVAQMGTVAMAGGDTITLNVNEGHLVGITASPSTIQTLIENRSAVMAPGGLIILSARAVNSLEGGVIRNSGTLAATGMVSSGGRIVLEASTSIDNTGKIGANAGAEGGPAGTVTIKAPQVENAGAITATAVALPSIQVSPAPATTGGTVAVSANLIEQSASGVMDASGLTGGTVALQAVQSIQLSGSIRALGEEISSATPATPFDASIGGNVQLTAEHGITLENARIDVSGFDGAGSITIRGGDPLPSSPPGSPPALDILGSSELDASSRRGRGGAVTLTAAQVNLLDGSTVDASGTAGGGTILVGGGLRGKDPAVTNALRTTVAAGVTLDASATQDGNGGQVVVWSQEDTTYAGTIDARGGGQRGAGGQIEVSGAQLNYSGKVNAGAPHGAGGSLLLDPQNLTVDSSGTDSLANETFSTNPSTDSVIAPSAITAVTDTGTAVTLQANNNLTINSSIVTSASGAGGAMTFQAGNSIAVNASVISDNGNVSFSANDPGATAADRAAGTATFSNNSVIDAGSGTVNITMGTFAGTGAATGTIETGHVVAANLNVTQDGPTAGAVTGAIDLGETDLTGNLSITASSDRNVTNTLGAQGTGGEVVVRGTATISVGAGDVTINGPNTDFNIIGLTAGNVTLNDASAVQFAASNISGNLTETTVGPIASIGAVQVGGTTTLTANNGGFGYADPYINLTNASNHFAGAVTLDVASTGATGTGGYADIRDSGAIDIASSTLATSLAVTAGGNVTLGTTSVGSVLSVDTTAGGITTGTTTDSYENLTGTGAVSLGATTVSEDLTVSTNAPITNTGAIAVGRQTELTAGSANNITLDNAGNSFDYMRVVSGDNVTLVDTSGMIFGQYGAAGGWTSHIYGNLSLTAGGDINQVGSTNNNPGYSAIEVDGATTFTANNATAPINLFLGSVSPGQWGGQPNDFVGAVTLARTNTNTGFAQVDIRNTNAGAAILNGLTSVGTLTDVSLIYDNAPAVTLPAMTVSNDLYVWAPSVANTASTPTNIVSESGPIVVGQAATFDIASTGDINLTNASNNFQNDFGVVQARNVSVQTTGSIILWAAPGYNQSINGNLTVTAGGNISDTGNSIYVQNGTASFSAGGNVTLTGPNFWNIVEIPQAVNVALRPYYGVILGNSTISGTLSVVSYNSGDSLTQVSGSAIDMTSPTATATFQNFLGGLTLANADNVLGPLAISNVGALSITENDAITQASAWRDYNGSAVGYAVTLTTTNDQAITLNQSNNYLGALTLTQNGSSSTPGAVVVDNSNGNAGITQGGAWSLAGATTLDPYSYSISLKNPNNVLGPLQILSTAGTTNGVASSIAIYAKNTASTSAISDAGAAGAWSTGTTEPVELVAYDSTGATEGGGNISLTNPANVLGGLYIKANNVTVTENNSITDGPVLSKWDGAGDSGWATTGNVSLVVANPAGKSIDLSNLDNLIGPIALSTTGTAGTLSSVLVTDNQNLTQNGAWEVGSAPVTLDARTHAISLTNAANVLGNITINTANGTPSSVAITENDAITQGSAWALTGVPVTLVAENNDAITLTNASNIMGNLTLTGGAVSVTENGSITQGGAWTTTGTTTLDPTAGAIALTNTSNQLGPIAIGGTPSAVGITENADITQASAWVDGSTPFTLDSQSHDILLTQASNQLGNLILTGQNASVTENSSAGITEGGAWSVPGTTTLTAGTANPIVLDAVPANSLGTVSIVSASTADIWTTGGVVMGNSTVSSGDLEINAGGAITQSGVITAPELLLVGTGDATLTNGSNSVGTLAAGFSGGDLSFTNSGDLAIGVIGGTTGVTIGAHNVTLTSVNGTVTGLTDVNASSSSLTVDAGTSLSLPQMSIAGAQTYTAPSGITLTAGLTSTASGPINFESPVTLAADLTVQSTNSAIDFANTVTGAGYQLNVNAGSGLVTFANAVSGLGATTDASAALTLASGGAAFASTLSANNGLAVTGPVTFNDTVTLADGSAASVFTGLVTLGKAGGMSLSGYNGMSFDGGVLLQNGPASIDSNNSPLVFQTAGSVSGPYGLTLDSGTASITGLNRMGSDLTSLSVTALSPTIPAGGISIAGPQSYTETSNSSITLDGTVTSTAAGAITFDGPVLLGAAVTVASDNSLVDFAGTVDGNQNLTVSAGTGATDFTGSVGTVTPVGSGTGASLVLEGTGATTFASNVQTRSGMTAAGPVIFDGNVTLGNGDTASAFSGAVTAGSSSGSTLDSYKGIAFDGGLILSGGAVTVDSNGGTIAFGGPVTGAESLTLNALAGTTGTVTGLDQIGPSSDLTALDVTAESLSLPGTGLAVAGPMTFTAAGGITLNGAVGSASSPASGAITFNGPMTLATGPVTVSSANAPVAFNGTLDGAETLAVNAGTGTTTFASAIGGTTALSALQTGSGGTTVIDAAGVDTSGAQNYGGPVTLGTDATLTGANIDFHGTVDGAHALTITDSGTTTLGGTVGGAQALTSVKITASAGIAMNTSTVTTAGSQTYDGAVTLGMDSSFSGNGIDFGSTVGGAHALTADAGPGALIFAAAVGGSSPLTSVSATGEQITSASVTSVGAQSYTAVAGLSLGGALNTSGGDVTVTGPTTLTANTSIGTGGGNINFSGSTSTVNGDFGLTLAAGSGNVVLGGVVGAGTALSSFTDSGYDLTLPDVTTVGDANQSYTALDNITLTQSRTVNAPVSFTADSDGNGAGSFILQNGVSLTASNNSLSITAADIQLQGNSTLSSGTGVTTITATDGRNIYLGGSTTAAGQLTITGDELSRISSSGGLVLNTTGSGWIEVNGITAQQSQNITGALDLSAQGTGDISFVTAPSTFTSVKADAVGGTTNVGVNITTEGHSAEFVTPVTISGASTIASGGGNISFDSGVSVANDLTLDTGNGTLTFGGAVGSTSTLTVDLGGGAVAGLSQLQSSLTGLTVNSTSAISLPAIDISGPQVYNTGAIALTGNLAGTGIEFNSVVTSAPTSGSSLTLNAGTGTLSFNDLANFQSTDMTLVADSASFAKPVAGSGSLVIEPYTASTNIAVGGTGAPISGLNLTAADLGELPLTNLASLTIGSATGTGSIEVAGPLNVGGTPLTLNGGGGIAQSGAITSGALTLNASGNAIDLANSANAVGAVAIEGAPSAVTLDNSQSISQLGSAGWVLGTAPVTLNAGTSDITVGNAGNTFGVLDLTGSNATVYEEALTNIGTSALSGDLQVTSVGGVAVSGALDVQGNVNFVALGEITQTAPMTVGGNLDAVTALNAGDVTINNSGASSTTLGNSSVGGNYSLTATGESVTQAAGSALQVVGNVTVTAGTVDLSGAANLIGGTTSLPASNTTVIEKPGVINLASGTYSGNLTVISQRTSRTFGSSQVAGNAIVLDNASNDIGGAISLSASPPVINTGSDVQTGITQAAGSSINVSGVATFTAENSSAGSLGIQLTNSGNELGTLQVSGTTVAVDNASTGATTLENSAATTSLDLTTAGSVVEAGPVVTPALSITASGPIGLGDPGNQIGALSANTAGNDISVVDGESLALGAIDAGGGTLSIATGNGGDITQTAAITQIGTLSVTASGAVSLTNTGNAIQTLGASSAGTGWQLYDANALGVSGAVSTATGDMIVRASGDVTLESGGSLTADAGNLVVSTEGNGNFINDSSLAGAALGVGSGDRWLVYSDTPDLVSGAHTVKGGLTSNFRYYGATYSTYAPGSVAQSGDGYIYDYAKPTLVINAVINGSASQVYGDSPTGTLTYSIVSGLVDSEDTAANVITGGTAAYSMALSNTLNAGTYTIKYTGGLTSNYTVQADSSGTTYTVTPAVLSYVATAASRTYGAANPTLTGSVTGFKLNDTAGTVLTGTANWTTTATAASGVGAYAIDGSGYTPNGNYTLEQAAGNATALAVTKAPLTVTASNDTVTYDGAGFSGGNGVSYSGFVNGQGASVLGGTLAFGGNSQGARNAGTYAITPSGLSSGNYAITYDSGLLTINKAVLDVTTSAVTKTYDGTLSAVGTPIVTDGTQLFGTDSLSGGTYAFTNANAGSANKTVTVSGVTINDGNGGNNYAVTYVDNAHSTINPESITVSADNVSKIYDGTDTATGTATVVAGTLYRNVSNGGAQDNLSGGTFAFTDPNAGSGDKTVKVSGVTVTDGNGGANYAVTYADNTTSTITPAALTFSGTVASKTYDGSSAASLSGYTLTGLVGSQTLGASIGAANFSDPNAGTGKSVAISGITLVDGTNGGLASNYTVSPTATGTGTIDPKLLTVDATVASKVYDGTTAATVESYGLSGFVGSQTVRAVYTGSASFDNKNAGTGKQVSITGITLVNGTNGGLATNYAVPTTVTASADITPATLQIAGVVADNKIYDGTTTAYLNTQSAVLTGLIGSDQVSVSQLTGTFATKNVGTNIAIGTGTVVLSGADAGNYTLVQPSGLTADITPRSLTVSATGVSRTYNGSTAATVLLSDNVLPGDAVSVTSNNAFLDPNVGQNKYIDVSNIVLSGPDAQDYIANASASAYANITPATLLVTATAQNKPYDGSAAANVTLAANVIPGDQVNLGDASAAFDNSNPGTGKTVTVDGIYIAGGAAAGNYVLANTTATTKANITGSVPGNTSRPPFPPPHPPMPSVESVVGVASLAPSPPPPQPVIVPVAPSAVLDVSLPPLFGVEGGKSPAALSASSLPRTSLLATASADSGTGGLLTPGTSAAVAVGSSVAASVSSVVLGGQGETGASQGPAGGVTQGGGSPVAEGGVHVSLVKMARGAHQGLIVVSVPAKLIEQRAQFRIPFPAAVVEAIGRSRVAVTGVKGGRLPSWLRYDPVSQSLIAGAVPAGALPYKTLVRAGEQGWVIMVTEQTGGSGSK